MAKEAGCGVIGQEVGNFAGQMIPGYGAYLDIKEAANNPTAGNIGTAVLTTAGDIFTLGAASTLLRLVLKAGKAYKSVKKARAAYKSAKTLTSVRSGQTAARARDVKEANNAVRRVKQQQESVKKVTDAAVTVAVTHAGDVKDASQRLKKTIARQ